MENLKKQHNNALAIGAASFASTSKDIADSATQRETPKLLTANTLTRPKDYIFPTNFNPIFVGVFWPAGKALETFKR